MLRAKNPLLKYFFLFCITVLIAVGLLVVGALLPQDLIEENVRASAELMYQEGFYPSVGDHGYSAQLDNFTDAIMLMASQFTNAEQVESILTNPVVGYDGFEDYVDFLYRYSQGEAPDYQWSYNRYWMGFRPILRVALLFLNYFQIRRYLAFVLFGLFAWLIGSMVEKLDMRVAMAFAFSIILIRPYVICNSLQLSCCFLIAFAAMLAVPWVYRNPRYEKLFFMEIGMVTMYFDFYTVPLITFGFPAVYLYLLYEASGKRQTVKCLLSNAFSWFAAYVMMWISKMLLTAVFTKENAFEVGFGKLATWLGFGAQIKEGARYSPMTALIHVATSVAADVDGAIVIALSVGILALGFLRAWKKGAVCRTRCRKHMGLLAIAAIPIIWFVVASEPTTSHFWFQYRSIALSYWAVGAYCCVIMPRKMPEAATASLQDKK